MTLVVSAILRAASRISWNDESCSGKCLFTPRVSFDNWGGSQASDSNVDTVLLRCFFCVLLLGKTCT